MTRSSSFSPLLLSNASLVLALILLKLLHNEENHHCCNKRKPDREEHGQPFRPCWEIRRGVRER